MSRRVYRRPVGRVRRLNCVFAVMALLLTGRVRKLFVRCGCPPHVFGMTTRGRLIHFAASWFVEDKFCWWLIFSGQLQLCDRRLTARTLGRRR